MATGNIKKFELKLGRAGLIIVIVGFSALLCAFFLLGVTVGKNIDTYPEKIASLPQRALALVWRPAKIKAQQNLTDHKTIPAPQTKENIDLTYHSDLTSKKGAPQEQSIAEKKPPLEPVTSPLSLSQPAQTDQSKTAEMPKADKEKPDQSDKPVQKAAGETKPRDRGNLPAAAVVETKFVIQVASLKEKTKAAQMHKNITAMGYQSTVVKTEIQGKGTWFRVIVTGFETKVQAQAAADKIAQKIKIKCIIKKS